MLTDSAGKELRKGPAEGAFPPSLGHQLGEVKLGAGHQRALGSLRASSLGHRLSCR